MDKQRNKFVAEINRLLEAKRMSKSPYLKKDYAKKIVKMQKELDEYDFYKKNRK